MDSKLIKCYCSTLPIQEQDPLSIYVQRVGGWISIQILSVDYYVPAEYAYMLELYDPNIRRMPQLDYYAAGSAYNYMQRGL